MAKKNFMSKKVMSGLLAVATVFTLNTSAFAADATPAPSSEVAGITAYNTSYTTFVETGDTTPVDLAVGGMTKDYGRAAMDWEQAYAVDWEITASTVDGIKKQVIPKDDVNVAVPKDDPDAGFISSVSIDVKDVVGSQYGYAVVQADYTKASDQKMNLAIVFNPNSTVTITPVKDVKCTFDAGDGTVVETTLKEVGKSSITGTAVYPNALEATSMAGDAIDKITAIEGISNGYITSITINGKIYANEYGVGTSSWMYKVYDKDHKLVKESADLGAGILQLQDDYTVEWTYAVYEG